MSEDIIIIENVYKSFRDEQVLKNITYTLKAGKIYGLIGNNGSGKTVLLKCICGFLIPDSGKILVRGKQIGRNVDFPENIGVIIESPGFLPNMTGMKNLRILAALNGKINNGDIKNAICKVGLDPNLKKNVGKYSLGMRQRLGIAQAIMENPDILILDEPFNGLDKKGIEEIRRLIQELKQEGKTILLVSHNQKDIDILCDEVCEIDNGRLEVLTK